MNRTPSGRLADAVRRRTAAGKPAGEIPQGFPGLPCACRTQIHPDGPFARGVRKRRGITPRSWLVSPRFASPNVQGTPMKRRRTDFVVDHLLYLTQRSHRRTVHAMYRRLGRRRRGIVWEIRILHEADDSCCRRQPWPETAAAIVAALARDGGELHGFRRRGWS